MNDENNEIVSANIKPGLRENIIAGIRFIDLHDKYGRAISVWRDDKPELGRTPEEIAKNEIAKLMKSGKPDNIARAERYSEIAGLNI